MKEKERLLKAIHGEETDRPPCICPGGMMNMITTNLMDLSGISWPQAHTDANLMAKLALAGFENHCFENVGVPFCMTVEAECMGAQVTMGTKFYEPHVTGYAISSVDEWKQLKVPDWKNSRAAVVVEAIHILKSQNPEIPIVGNLTGPISTASSLMEPVDFYKQLRKKNKEAHKFLSFVTNQIIHFAKLQLEAGADIITISDPSGTGEILGPKMFEEFAVTYLNQIVEAIHEMNHEVIIHICGQMKSVYSQLSLLKSDVLSFDAIVPMKEARKNLPDRVLMGNVSTYTLEFGTTQKVETLTKHCVENGSNIISPACGLGTKSPIENIQAMLKYLKEGTDRDYA